jgi:hypothetical protein
MTVKQNTAEGYSSVDFSRLEPFPATTPYNKSNTPRSVSGTANSRLGYRVTLSGGFVKVTTSGIGAVASMIAITSMPKTIPSLFAVDSP